MATERSPSERFEDIDWSAIENSPRTTPKRTVAFAATMVIYAAWVAYDYFLAGRGDPTLPGTDWHATGTDWLLIATLIAMLFYLVLPLAMRPRMTRYYWKQFRKNRIAVLSLAFLIVIFVVGLVGPMLITRPEVNVIAAYQPPIGFSVSEDVPVSCMGPTSNGACHATWAHPLGTSGQGKDIAKLVVFGMRVSMEVGLIATLIQVVIGTAVGTVAAYYGGFVDEILMRYVDIQLSFPTLILFLLLTYIFGGSLFLLILIFGIAGWGGIARLVRGEALQRAEETYITAAEGVGASPSYTVFRHLVPNVSNTIITAATLGIPVLILSEAALAFLGLTDPTVPSWGLTISHGRGDLGDAWWISTIPGVFLFFTIMAFNFVGDALRDALDPRQDH